jgi:hypothetical protein
MVKASDVAIWADDLASDEGNVASAAPCIEDAHARLEAGLEEKGFRMRLERTRR